MHIRTDDEVYRVDAVWLGPPRATFPWRARYSAYGVGLIVIIVVMFVQRRLGVPLGFFSVAWAVLITVLVTRYVSRRINDERPLLEWLTLFLHELRGPRARTRPVGSTLTTGHVQVHRERPRPVGPPTALALPPGSTPVAGGRVSRADGLAGVAGPVAARGRGGATTDAADTPGAAPVAPGHRVRRPSSPTAPTATRTRRRVDAGFGPPSTTEVGEPVHVRRPERAAGSPGSEGPTPALPPAPRTEQSAASVVASWTSPEPERAARRTVPAEAESWGPYPAEARATRSTGPFGGAFGPGVRRAGTTTSTEDDGARP